MGKSFNFTRLDSFSPKMRDLDFQTSKVSSNLKISYE